MADSGLGSFESSNLASLDAVEDLFDLPLDDLNGQTENSKISSEALLQPSKVFSQKWLSQLQKQWPDSANYDDLNGYPRTMSRLEIQLIRQGLDGHVIGYREISNANDELNATNSSSLNRRPAAKADFVRGKTSHIPFHPGGLAPSTSDVDEPNAEQKVAMALRGADGLYQVPPGFSHGLPISENWDTESIRPLNRIYTTLNELQEQIQAVTSKHTEIDDLLPEKKQLADLPVSRDMIPRKEYAHVVDSKSTMENFHQLVPEMAIEYPFELDNFQKEAVYHLEMGDSVFVAAHTSAGKTVVAEYAIALAQKHMTRAIYTSPIKALSNQKFRDFKTKFEDVGILTGDVQVNPDASCLIMTTEILRSMLYRGSDLIRDVEFVIFDEVHYVNDLERGVVWEEVIIMLPAHVTLILLSATVPNTKEFASWVGRTKKKNIYVISTSKRPVPLEHYLYVNQNMYKIVDQNNRFLSDGYKEASLALKGPEKVIPPAQKNQNGTRGRGNPRGRGNQRGRGSQVNLMRGRGNVRAGERRDVNVWVHLVGHLQKQNLLPVIVFVFSKKRCEEYVDTLANRTLNTQKEKSEVHIVIEKAIARLKKEDRNLPQIGRMRDMLSRGLAVHHGGLLPIVKEIVELLFQRGLVKVLFATETFAMGVNMPAKSVVFSGTQKHDGRSFRDLLPGEYTQCSGRAGRRGLDSTGTVIILVRSDIPDTASLHHMILGTPTKLVSQFRLTYNMVLNLLRVETLRIEDMIKRSFSENASQMLLPQHEKEIVSFEDKLETIRSQMRGMHTLIGEFLERCLRIKEYVQIMHQRAIRTPNGRRLFKEGRVVVFQHANATRSVAVLLGSALTTSSDDCSLEAAFLSPIDDQKRPSDLLPFTSCLQPFIDATVLQDWSRFRYGYITLSTIERVCDTLVKVDCNGVRDRRENAFKKLAAQFASVHDFGNSIFDEIVWTKVKEFSFKEAEEKRHHEEMVIATSPCLEEVNFTTQFALCYQEHQLNVTIENLRLQISDQNLELLPDYEQRIRVLEELGYIDSKRTVQLKGRVACEINSANELILTELILENTLAEFTCEEIVALLSAFVFSEKTEVEPTISAHLAKGKAMILSVADRVNSIQEKHQVLYFNEGNDFESQPRFGLMEVCYEWARGMSFQRITDLTDVLEGSIVRTIIRLDEVLRECRGAARVVGDASMYAKMEECQNLIRRNIVFCPSLYM
ncbi:ski complex RNA helicase Ski2 [Schizosaccharomyces japonicus yFS275]|uniref:Ski complex RNA helicase Ski2 n=1 Tax=Schizosaccharomyces japonicus (strain yFS275 / FY16936) TaxID=402676 RepID=B6K5Z2_SCHJY|nr:ski complex RNA helicase Ski2 [Schizosaccharomyces japonicus yFS275]EEB08946.2 ski complex RNA helicase Ski2 [Schizosaccharomyces japonicus yFS275]